MTDKVQDKLNDLGINGQRVQVLNVPRESVESLLEKEVVVFDMDMGMEHMSVLYPRYVAIQVREDNE